MIIDELRPYVEYGSSDQEWIGDVPKHWAVVPNRSLFIEIRDRDHADEEMLSVTIAQGIVKQAALLEDSSKKDGSNVDKSAYKLVQPSDIAYNKMRAWQGALGASAFRGIISPAYVVMRLRSADAVPTYFHHLYRTPQFAKEAERWSYGITSDMWSLRPEHFKMIYTPVPPPVEQAAIVRFLEWANGRLERAIRAKRKVIALLNEQKQAVVHRAVTRGVDSSVPLKPSGIPWLGDIPLHWELVALGRLSSSRCDGPFGSGLKSSHYTDSGVRVIRLQNIGSGEFSARDAAFISAEHYATLGEHGVVNGDLLVAGLGDEKRPAGRACVAPPDLGLAMVKADCFRFRLKGERAIAQFVAAQLSATAVSASACLSTGATRTRINLSASASRSVAIPPVAEQRGILTALDRATAPLSSAVSHLDREISLLLEYRTRLVSDVVTGKLDVRDVAARLPAEAMTDTSEEPSYVNDEIESLEDEIVA